VNETGAGLRYLHKARRSDCFDRKTESKTSVLRGQPFVNEGGVGGIRGK